MRSLFSTRWSTGHGILLLLAILGNSWVAQAGEPDRKIYWNVEDIRPGMKGTGQTVMVGTKLEEFGAPRSWE